jgi:DNA-binding NtrC family response regulator
MLEQAEPRASGTAESRVPDFALIADSSRDVRAFADSGRLRVDLYVRLSMTTIALPPLRERGNDVLLLARHFLDKFTRQVGKPAPPLSDRLGDLMLNYPWPGNVAELEGLMHRLAAAAPDDVIDVPDLPTHMRYMAAEAISLKRSLAEVEAEHIRDVVASVGGNKTRAVEILGINRKTLREKLRQPARPRTRVTKTAATSTGEKTEA